MKKNKLKITSLDTLCSDGLPEFLKTNKIKRVYTSSDGAYQFDVLEDIWTIELEQRIDVEWMQSTQLSTGHMICLRLALARQAESLSFSTIKRRCQALKGIRLSYSDPKVFQESYHKLGMVDKRSMFSFFNKIIYDDNPRYNFLHQVFVDVFDFIKNIQPPAQSSNSKNIFDPSKGMYTESEELTINTQLRYAFTDTFKDFTGDKIPTKSQIIRASFLIANGLVKAIFRRPNQLEDMKWADILPVGISFASIQTNDSNSLPKQEHLFSDVNQLHIRTFKGKSGKFRLLAEISTHRIQPDFSEFILLYRKYYQKTLKAKWESDGIILTTEEIDEIMMRLPLFPQRKLFTTNFSNKKNIFKSTGHFSNTFHRINSLAMDLSQANSRLFSLSSERTPKFSLGNNRIRHTVLTNGAWQGLSVIELSKITGVSRKAINPYIDLRIDSRFKIDTAFAQKSVFMKFGMTSAKSINQLEQNRMFDEYGDEVGLINQTTNCISCDAQLGKPLGCYGCDNFRPHIDGNHQKNLHKIERKLDINKKAGGSPITIRMLERSMLFIKATILACTEHLIKDRGISDERN